jgi:hypothetical protein
MIQYQIFSPSLLLLFLLLLLLLLSNTNVEYFHDESVWNFQVAGEIGGVDEVLERLRVE